MPYLTGNRPCDECISKLIHNGKNEDIAALLPQRKRHTACHWCYQKIGLWYGFERYDGKVFIDDVKDCKVPANEFELEKKIARILATQYWSGNQAKRKLNFPNEANQCEAYISKSLINWIDAARGVITLVRRQEQNPHKWKAGEK